jgi:hypothetical protein
MRRMKIQYVLLVLTAIVVMVACDDFFEVDISNKKITLIVPADGIETELVTQTFTWDELDGASSYHLMVVTPDFAAAESLILDTIVTTTYFEKTLVPGSYEWRVRGENNAYKTDWSSAKFVIYSSGDLTRQTVLLSSPAENYFTNKTTVTVKWNTLYNADSYEVRAYKDEWEGTLLFDPVKTTVGSAELTLSENEIWWGVKAINDSSESQFTTRRLIIDLTPPVKPTLLLPSSKEVLSDTEVDFSWKSNDVTWSDATTDSLFIYYDSDLTESVKEIVVTGNSSTIELATGKTYYWRVNSTDKAGNTGDYSSVSQFSIK